MSQEIDRYGDCPNCNTNWNKGDIYESLSKMDINLMKSATDILKLAGEYGWSPTNKKNFSSVNIIEVGYAIFYECPDCNSVYNSTTGEQYKDLVQAKKDLYKEIL